MTTGEVPPHVGWAITKLKGAVAEALEEYISEGPEQTDHWEEDVQNLSLILGDFGVYLENTASTAKWGKA